MYVCVCIFSFIAHLLEKKSCLKGHESKEPWCSLFDSTGANHRWRRWAISMGSAKIGRFFCLLSEGHNVVGRCVTYNCHMAPLDNTAVIKNNTWTPEDYCGFQECVLLNLSYLQVSHCISSDYFLWKETTYAFCNMYSTANRSKYSNTKYRK